MVTLSTLTARTTYNVEMVWWPLKHFCPLVLLSRWPARSAQNRKQTGPEIGPGMTIVRRPRMRRWICRGWIWGFGAPRFSVQRFQSTCFKGFWDLLEGPTRKPRHASVFSTHSDTQAVPAFHCIRMFKSIFSTRAFLKRTHRHAVYHCLKEGPKTISTR